MVWFSGIWCTTAHRHGDGQPALSRTLISRGSTSWPVHDRPLQREGSRRLLPMLNTDIKWKKQQLNVVEQKSKCWARCRYTNSYNTALTCSVLVRTKIHTKPSKILMSSWLLDATLRTGIGNGTVILIIGVVAMWLTMQTRMRAMGNGKRKPERILREMLPGIANVCRLASHRVKDITTCNYYTPKVNDHQVRPSISSPHVNWTSDPFSPLNLLRMELIPSYSPKLSKVGC